eukprot:COSAG05_NODE_975_length_6350_cov_6.983523_6_plen_81_part_00
MLSDGTHADTKQVNMYQQTGARSCAQIACCKYSIMLHHVGKPLVNLSHNASIKRNGRAIRKTERERERDGYVTGADQELV